MVPHRLKDRRSQRKKHSSSCFIRRNPWGIKHPCSPQLRPISTSKLNTLRCVHFSPINPVIYWGSKRFLILGWAWRLRCFQRLSRPDLATLRCRFSDNRHTRDPSLPVLSSRCSLIAKSLDYIFTPTLHRGSAFDRNSSISLALGEISRYGVKQNLKPKQPMEAFRRIPSMV